MGACERAFVWRRGTMKALPRLSKDCSRALDINDAGWIVGWGRIGGRARVFLLIPDGA